MNYRVEAIARAAGVTVDTVRFYQSRGLLPPPERRGRIAYYSEEHLARLRRIRELNRNGLKLEAVGRALREEEGMRSSLLDALSEAEGERTYSRAELARSGDIPEFLLASIEEAGLLHPIVSGVPRYTESDLGSIQAGRTVLEAGVPLQELLPLARDHNAHVEAICERAVELFELYVRRTRGPDAPSTENVMEAFRALLPAVTTLVALHFQRTLIRRARARLAEAGDQEGLEAALAATESARLRVSWR